jgi:2-methylisocitrate lyase-like PEP mutase family enzyme
MATVTRQDIGSLGEQAEALRRLHLGPRPLVLPNAWDVASARPRSSSAPGSAT